MAMHISWPYQTANTVFFSITRMTDGYKYDFAVNAFVAGVATQPTLELHENSDPYLGLYEIVLNPTPAGTFIDGWYRIQFHVNGFVQDTILNYMANGDDNLAPSSDGTGGTGGTITINYEEIVQSVWQYQIEDGINAGQAVDIILAVATAIVNGIGNPDQNIVISQPVRDSTAVNTSILPPRVQIQADDNGNRFLSILTPNPVL